MTLLRNNMSTSKAAVDKYIGTYYDVIKAVHDQLTAIKNVSDMTDVMKLTNLAELTEEVDLVALNALVELPNLQNLVDLIDSINLNTLGTVGALAELIDLQDLGQLLLYISQGVANSLDLQALIDKGQLTESFKTFDYKTLGWPGTYNNCYVDGNNDLAATSINDWSTIPATWDEWKLWSQGTYGTIVYTGPIYDIGFEKTFLAEATVTGVGTPVIEVSYGDDQLLMSNWATLTGQVITARYVRFRITIATLSGAKITGATFVLKAKSLIQITSGLDTSTLTNENRIAAGHVKIPLTETFSVIKAVDITFRGTGGGFTYEVPDAAARSDLIYGPEVTIYNSSNVLADAVLDTVTIRGA